MPEAGCSISIHALREEGDDNIDISNTKRLISIHALREEGDFRPDAGGKREYRFLSTPSARRATLAVIIVSSIFKFLSTPSARRATTANQRQESSYTNFYPRPPRGGRPLSELQNIMLRAISIHALREEGDLHAVFGPRFLVSISIHALREEGDSNLTTIRSRLFYFYPRPPRGGRHPRKHRQRQTV